MYKNLCAEALGVTGRQSEIIEFALTYGFEGFDIDFQDFARRAEKQGINFARSLISSAKLTIGGFELPVRLDAGEPVFRDDLNSLKKIADLAKQADARRCYLNILPGSIDRSFDENHTLHVNRLAEIADAIAPSDVTLGIAFSSDPTVKAEFEHPFIDTAEQMLKLLEEIPGVGLVYDSFTWFNAGGNLEQIRGLGANRISSVRLADAPLNSTPGELTESARLLPGEGQSLDHAELISWLTQESYNGPISPYPYPDAFANIPHEGVVQFAAEQLERVWPVLADETAS